MDGGGSDKRLVVRIAADDLVEDDNVGRLDIVTLAGEVQQVSPDSSFEPGLLQELGGIRLVGGRELDVLSV